MNKDVIRKIYDAMSKEYDMAEDFDTFAQDIQNKDVARRVYDAMYDRYRMEEDFEEFYKDLTFMPSVDGVKTTENGSVVVDEAPKKRRITLADTLNASVSGMVTSSYAEEVKEEQEKNMLTQEEKDQRAAMRQRLQEDGTIDRMKESKKEARREKLRAFGSMLGSTPQVTSFGVSTNVFDSTDEQLADVGQALDAGTEYRQNKLLQEKLDVALDMARAGENQDGLRGVENFGLGLWDSATRLSTWDFGASDIVNNLTLMQIVEKWENDPSSLTATEQKVLDGIGMATAVQEMYSDQVGIGYNVGQSLPESAGFMASMALNPASGLGKSLARNAVRTYGRNSIRKNLYRLGGDFAETAIMTATTGAGRVAADALERINGSSTYEIGENGVIMYGGQKDQETVGNAVIKAIGANFIENYSEALGEYFDPLLGMSRKVAAGGLRKMNLNKWADALSDVQPSQMTASIRALREKTKFGGIFGEIMEEEIGMALNTLFVGDNQWSDFVDLETQLTTVLSCAIMSGTLNGVEQVSSVAARRRMEKNAKNAERSAANAFGEQFSELRESIDQASPEGVVDVLRDVYMDQGYSLEQKRKLAEYAAARLQMQYYNAADAKARREVNKTQQGVLDAYEAGRHAQLPTYYNIEQEYRNSEEAINASENAENIWAAIETLNRAPLEEHDMIINDFTEEEQQLIRQYRYNAARVLGAVNSRAEQAEDLIDEYRGQIAPFTKPDGTVTTAILGDNVVFVMEQNENGDAVVHTNDGRKIFTKTRDLEYVQTHNVEELIERFRQSTEEAVGMETEKSFDHHPKTQTPQVGLQLQSPEGEVVITAVNDNMVEIVPAVYRDGQVQPKEGAEPRTITVDDAYMWQDSYYQGLDDAAAATASQPTVDNMSANEAENESTTSEEIEQSVSEEVADSQNATQPTETESVAPVAPAAPQTARGRVPKDEEGNPIYEQTDADTAWDAIVEETEGDTEMAQRVAADMLADKKAALAKLQNGKPKKGATVAEKIANEKVHQAAITQAQSDVAQWEAIVGTEARRREAAMSEADRYTAEMEQKSINEGLAALGEPQSLEEYVLGQLAGGAYKLRWSDKENGTKGFGSHTGLLTEEMKARLSMIDNKNGFTPEEIAHSIVENMDASFGEVDVMDVTNMVIDAVSTHASRRSMLNGMVESRAELMRQQARAEQEAKDAWYMEQYHATEEELAAYNEYLAEFAEEIYGEDTDYEQRIATFAEIQLGEYDNQGTDAGLRSSADQGEGLASDREGGRSVGEEEQLDRRELREDAAGVAEAEDGRAGSSVSTQSDDRQSRIDRAIADYRENVDDSPEAIAAAERDQQRYEADMAEDAAETVETLENGDVRRTNLNSNGEIATVAIERDGNVVSVDTYEDGALFERTDYDANGNATKVTRYKDGEVISEQEYKDGKRKVTANYFEIAEEAQKNRKTKKDKDAQQTNQNLQEERREGAATTGAGRSRPSGTFSISYYTQFLKELFQNAHWEERPSEEVAGIIRRHNAGKTLLARTEDERELLSALRALTNNEIQDELSNINNALQSDEYTDEEKAELERAKNLITRFINRGERNAVIEALTGAKLGEKLPLSKIDELFEMYNSDANVAELYSRVRAIAEQIGLDFWFEEMEDRLLGGYLHSDNRVRLNAHMLYCPRMQRQGVASTIVHEMLHAVAGYAVYTQKDIKLGLTPKVQLSKQVLSAANTLINIYGKAVKGNPALVHQEYDIEKEEWIEVADYGTTSVHEMLSEISNPEFRDKLKQIEYKGRSVWQRIWDAIKSMFTQSSDVTNPTAYDSMAKALDVLINEFSVDAYQKYSGLEESAMFIGERGASEENLRFRDGAPFFSNAERAVENIKQNKATPEQWLAMIKKDGGLKAGEDKWMGLSGWLNEKKENGVKSLTKDEVLAFIRENQIEIEEVEYGSDVYPELQKMTDELKEEFENLQVVEGHSRDNSWNLMEEEYGSRFIDAFDYPSFRLKDEEAAMDLYYDKYGIDLGFQKRHINSTRLDHTTEGLDNKKEIALVVPTIEPWNERDEVHFGDAGEGRAVAWVRFGETTDADGNRVLVIDEVQSKRHDEGRAKGYRKHTKHEEFRRLVDAMYDKYGANFHVKMTRDEEIEFDRLTNERIREDENNNSAVPDAPFDKNYHELVMKRMLRYAAENGFDKVAWTKGKQQAQRYDLNQVVSSIEYRPLSNGHYDVTAYGTNGYVLTGFPAVYESEQEMADVFGKEMAAKIARGTEDLIKRRTEHVEARRAVRANMEGLDEDSAEYEALLEEYAQHDNAIMEAASGQIEGEELSIGGEDRNALYDEMIPRFMNKYTKKWGTKVGEVTLPNVEEAGRTMWSVDVTPEMKESVMQGQPMFREGMGAISDREVSYENDPIAKFQGKPRYYGKRAAAFAERERRRMENAAKEAAEMLGIEAEIVTDASTLQGRKAKAKGWYDIVNKKVVVVVPNHVSMGDAVRTVLHEGIAHHGLRELFGDGFDAMLDNVYNNVSPELKARIDAIAERTGVSTSVATEEYLASLAETTNFEEAQRRGWWQKIKSYFVDMLRKLSMPGLKLEEEITDNELRYLLWRSYKNLVEPNSYLRPLGYAEDVVKQKELKVGEYAEKAPATPMAAEMSEDEESEAEEWAAITMQRIEELEAQAAQLENEIAEMEADRDADDASRYEMWEQQLEPLRKQMEDVYAELEGLYSLEAEAEKMSMASEDAIRYRLVDDPAEIERLESEPTRTAYRAMQVINGELYPPMSAVVDGKLREPIALGQWEQSEERPDLADGNGRFKLDKGNKKSLKAAYNPYFHSSPIPLNDQFSEAQSRDNLVTVEVEIPVSEADGTSGYKAEKAKDAVGTHEWKAGIIQSQFTGTRSVFLTRWDKPVRIVPDSEVADVIVGMFDGKDIVMPSNVVTPQLRKELEARGIAFVETDNQGKLVEGEHKGEHYSRVYGKKAESGLRYRDENLYTPQELAKMETPIHKSKGGFKNLAEAEVWAKENLQGKTRTNQFTGDEISIGKKSVSEMLNEKTLNQSVDVNTHLAALQSVLDFIETGIPAEVHKDTHGRDFDVMRLYNAIEVDGKVYRVKSTVRKVRQGDKYYTYEVQKMELIEERGANPNREGENPRNGNNSTNSISGAKLLKGVKKTNSNEEILPSDENIRNSEEIIAEVERESANLGVQVRIARSIDELPDADTRKRAEDGKLKGYFDPRTGEVVVYEPNTENANDAKRTILHEIVGHKGLRQLIGEQQYDKAMLQLMYMLPADVRDAVLRRAERHGWNAAIAMDEYLAEQAERDVQPTWWGKVNAKIRAILRNIGFNVMLTDADVTYLLWRSRKKLQGDSLNDMAVNAILKQAARKSAEAEAWSEQAFKDMEMRDFEKGAMQSLRYRIGDAQNEYDSTMKSMAFKQRESWQDSMRSLKVFMDILEKESGKKIVDFENAYMYENAMSSANLMEMQMFRHDVYGRLLKAIHELMESGAKYEDVVDYMMAKHGLERNEKMARKRAEKEAEGDAAKEAELYAKYREEDLSGLTALTGVDNVADAEVAAMQMVSDFESEHNTGLLWSETRACTQTILNISHDAGILSDEVYDELWSQYEYYIPLRGFDETTAEEMYTYVGDNKSPYNAPIKTAKGRKSKADDPIATIATMAESAIVEANRNRLKQRFLYMVERHRTELASVSSVWVEKDPITGDCVARFANISNDATPEEAAQAQKAFEERMEQLHEQEPERYYKASEKPNIPYRVEKKANEHEHQVIVKRNGKDVVITINGDPRVAQAINGQTNPEAVEGFSEFAGNVNRFLSANYTTRNPAFVVANFVRDGFYTNNMVWVKENPAYAWKYNRNWLKATKLLPSLVSKYKRYEKGDKSALDMSDPVERAFYEFMIYGGETGYTVINSVEDYKGIVSGDLRAMQGGVVGNAKKAMQAVGNAVDTFGRWAEDTSRFAAYMTSRQLGRTITKSIWDAKEISVNFNKKGSGRKMTQHDKGLNSLFGWMSQQGRNLYVFWNASMQGMFNFGKAAKEHPGKMAGLVGTYFGLGMAIAAIFGGNDDDDDYWNLPEYVRRNNICFRVGNKFVTLPLPIELRAIYGMGELAMSWMAGKEDPKKIGMKIVQQASQVLPIDMMAEGGGLKAFIPSWFKPIAEVYMNTDWTGMPIYRERTPFNEYDPTWTLAFKSTSPELVQMSRLVNEWTNKNTADGLERPYNRGWADNRYLNNPAVWEHILEGYLGGMATMFNQTKKTLMMPFNEDLREVRNVPIASRFIKDAGKEGRSYAARNEYYDAKNIMDSWKNEMSKAKKEVLDESLTDEQRLKAAKLRSSLEQQYMEAAERWKVLDRQRRTLEEAYKNDQSEDNRRALDDVMMQMATLVEAYRD